MQKKIFDLYQQRAATAHLTVYIAIRYEDVMYVGMYFTSMYARMSDKLECSGIQRGALRRRSIAQGLRIFPLFPSTAPVRGGRPRSADQLIDGRQGASGSRNFFK